MSSSLSLSIFSSFCSLFFIFFLLFHLLLLLLLVLFSSSSSSVFASSLPSNFSISIRSFETLFSCHKYFLLLFLLLLCASLSPLGFACLYFPFLPSLPPLSSFLPCSPHFFFSPPPPPEVFASAGVSVALPSRPFALSPFHRSLSCSFPSLLLCRPFIARSLSPCHRSFSLSLSSLVLFRPAIARSLSLFYRSFSCSLSPFKPLFLLTLPSLVFFRPFIARSFVLSSLVLFLPFITRTLFCSSPFLSISTLLTSISSLGSYAYVCSFYFVVNSFLSSFISPISFH